MVTEETVVRNVLAFLNDEISEAELVGWAEDAFVKVSEADSDIPNEDLLLDMLGYIAAADTPGFPLTWAILADFLERLGTRVRAVAEAV